MCKFAGFQIFERMKIYMPKNKMATSVQLTVPIGDRYSLWG
jgi:hypothetical protein